MNALRMVLLRSGLLVVTLLLAVVAPVAAQNGDASLAGRVVDQSQSSLPGVAVDVTSSDGQVRRIITDAAGRFELPGLASGRYDVTFSAPNFADVRRRQVEVRASVRTQVDATLQLSLNASVVVTANSSFRNLAELERPEENLVGVAMAASEGAVTGRQIEARPILRAGEVLEAVPGVIISQHSGEGKANQYYLRGFNLDHGTDFATTVAGVPVNLPTHAHGHGYSDLNALIPELVSGVQFRKGPYYASQGDFSAAGAANINYTNRLDGPIVSASAGEDGWSRLLVAASPRVGRGTLLAALEVGHNDGPWERPDDYRKTNAVARFSVGNTANAFSLTAMSYIGQWNSTDQVPLRAITDGRITRLGNLDPTLGGKTSRHNVAAEYQRTRGQGLTRATAFVSKYRLNLFSNFTYALDDAANGDQFEQADARWIGGGRVAHTRSTRWGARPVETTVGLDLRHDEIPLVALYRTSGRTRLSTVREDAVSQTSAGVFADSELRWSRWLRTTAGLRVDGYRFDVRAGDAANAGTAAASLASPKGGVILGPWRNTEFYVNAGTGYHSNDARGTTITVDPVAGGPADRVTPLVRAKGAEVGVRTVAIPRVQSTLAAWRLNLDSELLFVGDAGNTEAGRPSARYGLEWTNYMKLSSILTADADVAWSHARFADLDPVGAFIPGAAGTVASLGLTATTERSLFGSVRLRYFGPRPLVEDNTVRSAATSLVNAQLGYHLTPKIHLLLDAFNLLDSRSSDIDYFYTSRLPGEPAEGVTDLHTHPALPRSLRLLLRATF